MDRAGNKAGFGRGQAFDDFLHVTVCSLATGLMEEEYLATVRKGYDRGDQGKRGIDFFGQAFGLLVVLMEETRNDILGDLFQGGITFGEAGQFFTPPDLTELMAALTVVDGGEPAEQPPGQPLPAEQLPAEPVLADEPPADPPSEKLVCDPCCGSGRMLLAAAKHQRGAVLVGQDVDLRCVRMTTINLAFRGLYGFVLWGNSLSGEVKLGYRTGLNMYGRFVRPMRPDEIQRYAPGPPWLRPPAVPGEIAKTEPPAQGLAPGRQLSLFER